MVFNPNHDKTYWISSNRSTDVSRRIVSMFANKLEINEDDTNELNVVFNNNTKNQLQMGAWCMIL